MKRFLLASLLLALGTATSAFAATAAAPTETIKAQVSRDTVNLGDSLVYSVEVMTAGEQQFSPDITPPDLGSLFQVKDTFGRSSVNILNGRTHIINFKEVHLIANRTGVIQIPPSTVELIDPKTNQRLLRQTNPVTLTVNEATGQAAVPTPTPEIDVLKPIKKSAKFNPAQWSPFAIAGGVIVMFFTIMAYWRGRPTGPPPPKPEPVDPRTPEQRAFDALEQALELKSKGQYNEFYTSLSVILRRFMSEAYQFKAEEATTREMLREMERMNFKPHFLEKYRQYFLECDQVKFANVKPAVDQLENMAPRVKDLITDHDKLEPPPEPVPEAETTEASAGSEMDQTTAEKS